MIRKDTKFKWDGSKRRAVELVAQDVLTDDEIAREVGRKRNTIERWKREPLFSAAVNEAKTAVASALRAQGIAIRQNRIDALNDRWTALQRIRVERAADETLSTFPGGKTGFVTATLKSVRVTYEGDDENGKTPAAFSREVWEHSFDRAFFSAYQEVEKQMAQETGQWVEKSEQASKLTSRIELVGVNADDI